MKEVTDAADRFWNAWFKAVDGWFDLFLKSPAFVQGAGKALGMGMGARTRWNTGVEQVLSEMRVASKDDVDRIAAAVHGIEGKLNEILLRMDEAALSSLGRDGVSVPAPETGSVPASVPAAAEKPGTRGGKRRNGRA
ncbi:MAG: hypothetical protein FJ087_18155 [Deltaproteobacteria bacterium]|nr:hypothetical protein [Deltaproteobacteria bacterium]